jgi:phage terminase large subunit-like protein
MQADFPVLGYAVKSSTKMARSEAVSPLVESGKVWLPLSSIRSGRHG